MGEVEHIRQPKSKKGLIIAAVLVVLVSIGLSSSLVVTNEDEFTLIRRFGKVERIITNAGPSFKIPFVEESSTLPLNTLIFDLAASDVITQDKKTMVADSYVLWNISDPKKFVQTLNSQIANAESRINTTVYNALKNTISSMNQEDVISGRDGALNDAIMTRIGTTMEQYGIHIICVETKHLDLPSDNKEAVYQRMISERNNIAAKYTADGEAEATQLRAQTDKDITILLSEANATAETLIAEGEAEYMKILADAYKDQSRSDFYTFVRSLDAAKNMLTGTNKTLILNSDSPIAQIFNSAE